MIVIFYFIIDFLYRCLILCKNYISNYYVAFMNCKIMDGKLRSTSICCSFIIEFLRLLISVSLKFSHLFYLFMQKF